MFQLGKTIISEEIIENDFVCNLSACKGACCVEGEAGAPLEKAESEILQKLYPKIKPFLNESGIRAIEKQGAFIVSKNDELETPLVKGKECAYTVFDEGGIARCGIEDAYTAGEVDFQKPISCHLYPVRIKEYSAFTAVNYHRWHVCDAACILGKELQMPVYKFVEEALVRKFGKAWYADLEAAAAKLKAR